MRVTRGRRRVVASGVCRERAKRAARFGGCERFFGRRSVARSLCPHAHLNSPRLPPRGRPLRLRRRPGRAEGGRRGGGAPHFREQEWTAAAATQREQGVRAGSPPVPHFLFFSPPQRHTMASSALTTADALKQDARRAMVIASDKAKLASLALSRPDSMVRERGGGSSRSLPGAQCPPLCVPRAPTRYMACPAPPRPPRTRAACAVVRLNRCGHGHRRHRAPPPALRSVIIKKTAPLASSRGRSTFLNLLPRSSLPLPFPSTGPGCRHHQGHLLRLPRRA